MTTTLAIVDERISKKCETELIKRGFTVIKTPASRSLSDAVCAHPDMLMLVHKNNIITSANYCDEAPYVFSDIRELSPHASITFTDDEFSKEYPRDAIFNTLIIGDKMFAKTDTVSPSVLQYAKNHNIKIVKVRQGYPACTVLPISDNAAITADAGMAKALCKENIAVTLIEDGDISLFPHEYGFIGGAAGVFRDTVYFLGDIRRHRSKEKILEAIEKTGKVAVSLSDEPLADLGRIIFI